MKRVLEPVLMEDRAQAIAYARADFSESNQWFVDQLVACYSPYLRRVLDIGTGPADIPIRLVKAKPLARITAVDGSREMVRLARKSVEAAGLEDKIEVREAVIPGTPLNPGDFDAVISNSLLHHIETPLLFWKEVQRLAGEQTAVFFMDLFRPGSEEEARATVERVSGKEHPILKEDFYNSLLASFTVEEVSLDLIRAGLDLKVSQVSERHLLVRGILRNSR